MSLVSNNTLNDRVNIFNSLSESLNNITAVAILTEWEEFKNYNWKKLGEGIKIFDGRLIVDQKNLNINDIIASVKVLFKEVKNYYNFLEINEKKWFNILFVLLIFNSF